MINNIMLLLMVLMYLFIVLQLIFWMKKKFSKIGSIIGITLGISSIIFAIFTLVTLWGNL